MVCVAVAHWVLLVIIVKLRLIFATLIHVEIMGIAKAVKEDIPVSAKKATLVSIDLGKNQQDKSHLGSCLAVFGSCCLSSLINPSVDILPGIIVIISSKAFLLLRMTFIINLCLLFISK